MTLDEARTALLPMLENLREELAHKHPRWKLSVVDNSLGDGVAYQAHMFGLSCLARDAAAQSDLLDLTVVIADLATTPTISSADLVWGDGRIVAELLPETIALGAEPLGDVAQGLSTLAEAMDQALAAASR